MNQPDLDGIATRFVQARRAGEALPAFPGQIPDDLEMAYQIQDRAIAQWQDGIVGWKVGYIAAERRDHSGDDRLLGPIFAASHQNATGSIAEIRVFQGGFAAIEAEYVLVLDQDADAAKVWSPDEIDGLACRLYVGIEVASSPLATINQLGPRVVISDFGNNNGLIVGPEIADWKTLDEATLKAETFIEGQRVGTGGAPSLPGGLRTAIAFALRRSAQRGRPLRKGDLIATGNATGIHDIAIGQQALVRFQGYGDLLCKAIAA